LVAAGMRREGLESGIEIILRSQYDARAGRRFSFPFFIDAAEARVGGSMHSRETNGAHESPGGPSRLVPQAGRGLLKDRAYDEIKRYILNNDFPPGTFLAERQLAAQLGMSKTPVKAALERLELEGLICVSPQQGIVVRDLSVQEIADQYE